MRVLIRLLGFLKKHWEWALLAYVCLIASTAFSLGIPELVKRAIDTGINVDLTTQQISGDQQFLVLAGLAIVGAGLLRGAFAYGQFYLSELVSQRAAYDIRNLLYDRMQRLSFAYHDRAQTGELMSRATQDVEGVRFFVAMGAIGAFYIALLCITVSTLLIVMNWQLALVSLVCVPPVAVFAIRMGRKLQPVWMNIQEKVAVLGAILQENLSGVRVVRAFCHERYEQAKFEREAENLYGEGMLANRVQAFNIPLMTFIFILASALIIWYGGREVVAGNLTVGELFQFYFYLAMLLMPVAMLGPLVNLISRAISSGERIFEILDAESAVTEAPDAAELPKVDGWVRFQGVSFSYHELSPILHDVDLEAKPGEVIALLGSTGSGKSTLVNLIPRFYDVTGGSITIDGVDIKKATLASLRRNVGIVQQEVFLFAATIRDNIAYGAVDARMDDIVTASKAACLHDFIESLPEGYDTWVGERGTTLSGGQKQRLAIARTLLVDPRIIILDDSTSSVDSETEALIQQALREVMKGRTTFVIAHRLQTIQYADQILVLDEGRVVERGTHRQLMREGGIYPQIYELQFRQQEEALEAAIDSEVRG